MVDDALKNFRCICDQGYIGTLCEVPCSLQCKHGECTKDSTDTETCKCLEGLLSLISDLYVHKQGHLYNFLKCRDNDKNHNLGYHGTLCDKVMFTDANEPCEVDSDCQEGSR